MHVCICTCVYIHILHVHIQVCIHTPVWKHALANLSICIWEYHEETMTGARLKQPKTPQGASSAIRVYTMRQGPESQRSCLTHPWTLDLQSPLRLPGAPVFSCFDSKVLALLALKSAIYCEEEALGQGAGRTHPCVCVYIYTYNMYIYTHNLYIYI